jgi:hypothetical protein
MLSRKIEVRPTDLGAAGTQFAARVGRLIIVQDATATETALGNAANEMANDLAVTARLVIGDNSCVSMNASQGVVRTRRATTT